MGTDKIDNDVKKMWRSSLRYSALGLEMGAAVIIGYGAGWWLDSKFNTKPYLSIIMLLLGIAAGFRALIRVAMEVQKNEHNADHDGNSDVDGKEQ